MEKVEDVVNIGDMIWVKVTDIDDKGRVNLSYKDALKEIKAKKAAGRAHQISFERVKIQQPGAAMPLRAVFMGS